LFGGLPAGTSSRSAKSACPTNNELSMFTDFMYKKKNLGITKEKGKLGVRSKVELTTSTVDILHTQIIS
jgi:hypothetical protein